MMSHDVVKHVEVDDGMTKAHHLANEAQQEAEYELEAIELTTAAAHI
jgi:hypothetical protein